MSIFDLKTFWRGRSLKLYLSVTKYVENKEKLTSRNIDIDDLALVCLKVIPKDSAEELQINLNFKKKEAVQIFTVFINITSVNYAENLICSQDWATVPIKIIKPYDSITYPDITEVGAYTLEVNITAHAKMPAPSVVSNQLYEDTEFTDFQLDATDGSVAVHKTVLFIHSDMFRTMLRGNWKENKESQINIEGATVQTLEHLKEYMYLGTLPDEGLDSLLIIASRYLMKKLEEDCITKLIKTLKPEELNGLIEIACLKNLPQLMKALVLEIPDNILSEFHKLKIQKK